ncbi:MFS transporter [Winogradskya humida]|uniref:MFS transporter n=1 Tax=Winogradskya humida TaxID=113566 RepID=A0ABQ3ZZ69_9ACTN|nr:MFS transporter [Actinoplanes humidus]GIE23881.1 MFS transporter [Actinoplanes humidus]
MPVDTPEADVEVLRIPGFRRLWIANAFRDVGAEVAAFALPITAALLLHAHPIQMSLLTAGSRIGYPLLGLPAGVWVDRWDKRAVLIGADLGFLLALASIPIAYMAGVLSLPLLVAVTAVTSVCGVFFDIGHSSVLPLLLPRTRVADANARLQTTDQTVRAVAPSVAGALAQTIAAPLLYAVTATSHLLSLLFLTRLRPAPVPVAARQHRHFRREVADGLSTVIRHPLLRLLCLQAALNNIGAGILLTLMPLFLLRIIGIPAWLFGVLTTVGAVSGVLASLVGPRLRRRYGEIRMTVIFSALFPLGVLAAPLAAVFPRAAVPLAATAEILINFVAVGRSISTAGLRARVTPTTHMGRVSAAYGVVSQGATPIGALLAGLIASTWSITGGLWIGVAEMAVPALLLLRSPLRTRRTLPAEWEARDDSA